MIAIFFALGLMIGYVLNIYGGIEKEKSLRYKLVMPFLMGIICSMLFLKLKQRELLSFIIIIPITFGASIKDLKTGNIPNELVLVAFLAGLANFLGLEGWGVFGKFLGLLMGGGVFLLLHLISKGGMGMGDVKLMACTGFIIGFDKIISVMFLSVLLSGIAGLVLLGIKKVDRKGTLPFAPFLLGALVFTGLVA